MEAAGEDTQKERAENVLPENNAVEKTPTPLPQEAPKKSKREDRAKKDEKNLELFMKSLNSMPTLEEKLTHVCKKYIQTADDHKKMQFYIKQSDKRYALLLKEKEQLQLEFNKTILVKSKLENLCRELQKQNKAIKEESLLKIREEEERRKETQAKFQNTLSEITTLLQQNNEKNAKLRDDNITMSEKFKSVVQQYQLREQQVDKMAKQMSLESQLSDAKLQKASLEAQAEKERRSAEVDQLNVTLQQYRAKIIELQGTETALRGQLAVYTVKYDEFQNALVKSNQVFGGFKEQMEKMSKKIKKLEKESVSWKKRWETSQTALLEMCSERQAAEQRAAAAARYLHHMQGLCRTLQAERTVLLNTLKENDIERPPVPSPPPAPPAPPAPPSPTSASAPASNAKVDAMAANCAQLRQSLAHLQSQLNTLTNKQPTPTPEEQPPPKPEKSKKSKSKKSKAEKAQKAAQEKAETPKETESDESNPTKDVVNDKESNSNESTAQNEVADIPEDKVDENALENLIQAINSANINLNDLEVGGDKDQENELEDTGDIVEEVLKEIEMSPKENLQTDENSSQDVSQIKDLNANGETNNTVAKEENIQSPKKVAEVNANEELNDASFVEASSNDEISHIAEVKPILNEA